MLENIEPTRVMQYFEQICKIPHGSGNTKKISDYIVTFAKEHNLWYVQDEANNVIIKKPGRKSKNGPVILQGHIDMVCEKNEGVLIDFEKDGLDIYVENGTVKARGTTLGADDGIGAAYILAILESDMDLPSIEAVFTTDEETGMLGATYLDCSKLEGKTLINLDSEDEGHILVSCAGGVRAVVTMRSVMSEVSGVVAEIRIDGLLGGHSGQEIDKGRANASILLGRVLQAIYEKAPVRLAKLFGGTKDNAIPRSAGSVIVFENDEDYNKGISALEKEIADIKNEYRCIDDDIRIELKRADVHSVRALDNMDSLRCINLINTIPNGVIAMSMVTKGLVQTSLNLGIMNLDEKEFKLVYALRGNIESQMDYLLKRIQIITKAYDVDITTVGRYQPMEYKADSPLRELMVEIYRQMYNKEPILDAIHAGVECGIFAGKINDLDALSIGPDLSDIHTPSETMYIDSVRRTYEYLLEVLRRL